MGHLMFVDATLLAFSSTIAALWASFTIAVGVRRSRRRHGYLNIFHPSVFPVAYICLANLAPICYVHATGQPLGPLRPSLASLSTIGLLSVSTISFSVGASLTWRAARTPEKRDLVQQPRGSLRAVGWGLVGMSLVFATTDLLAGAITNRGLAQDVYTTQDSLQSLFGLMALGGVLCLMAAVGDADQMRFSKVDLILLLSLVAVLAASGKRATGLTIVLVILAVMSMRRAAFWKVAALLGLLAIAAFRILLFRNQATAQSTDFTFLEALLADLASTGYTTAIVERMASDDLQNGATVISALLRQLPSFISVPLLGPPVDTGTYVFRRLVRVASDMGYGFSVPAEGALNFGLAGVALLSFLFGCFLSWTYSRMDLSSLRPTGWIYVLAVAWLPFAWRSDLLGAIKGVLYPILVFALASAMSRPSRRDRVVSMR